MWSKRFNLRSLAAVAVCGALVFSAVPGRADILTQYSFENNLLDTAAGGSTADDMTAVAKNGVLSTGYFPGVVGQAVQVGRGAGQASILTALDSNDLDLASSSWTIETYIRPDANANNAFERIATKWNASFQWHWTLRTSNNGQDFFYNGGVNPITGGATMGVPQGIWSHIAMTNDPINGLLAWMNGSVVGSAPAVTINPGTDVFEIGNITAFDGAGSQYSGLVDEFQIHNMAMDSTYMTGRTALLPVNPVSPPPASGLVSYYTFDDTSDDVAGSYSQNVGVVADNLSPVGGTTTYAPGKIGNAVRIGSVLGDANALKALHSADVELPAVYTIETWINPSDLGGAFQRLSLNWGGDTAYHFAVWNSGDLTQAVGVHHNQSSGGAAAIYGGQIVAGEWQHVAVTADGTDLHVYLNGELVGSTPYNGTIHTTATEGFVVGDSDTAADPTLGFNGLMDDLAIWSVALTPEQIRYQYQSGLSGVGAVVPEPGSLNLIALGVLGLCGLRRFARNSRDAVCGVD